VRQAGPGTYVGRVAPFLLSCFVKFYVCIENQKNENVIINLTLICLAKGK
jgi:hypothetical protein